MKLLHQLAGFAAVLTLCALPAQGTQTTTTELHTLTPIDSLPTKDDIVNITGPDVVPRLRELALSETVDFGVQLRAIRALPQFCSPTCVTHPARQALLDVFASLRKDRSGQTILRTRAAIESLGLTRSREDGDVDLIAPYLADGSRDLRATAAFALRNLCNNTADAPLRARFQVEQTTQVKLAISEALRDLKSCSAP